MTVHANEIAQRVQHRLGDQTERIGSLEFNVAPRDQVVRSDWDWADWDRVIPILGAKEWIDSVAKLHNAQREDSSPSRDAKVGEATADLVDTVARELIPGRVRLKVPRIAAEGVATKIVLTLTGSTLTLVASLGVGAVAGVATEVAVAAIAGGLRWRARGKIRKDLKAAIERWR